MRHRNANRKLSRNTSHRRALLRNLVTSFLEHGRLMTTLPKAKDLRPIVEKLVTLGKEGTLAARRRAYASDMNLAQQALAANNLQRARYLIDRHRPKDGKKDLRGWEWRYLYGQCHGDELTNLGSFGYIGTVCFSRDGRWAAAAPGAGTGQTGEAGKACHWRAGLAPHSRFANALTLCYCRACETGGRWSELKGTKMRATCTLAVAVLAIVAARPALAEERDFCANRPGLDTPACTLAPGDAMVEVGLLGWDHQADASGRDDVLTLGDVTLRYGVAQSSEIELGFTSAIKREWAWRRARGESTANLAAPSKVACFATLP